MVGNKVADGGAGTLELRFTGQMNYKDVELLIFWRSIRAEPLIALNMIFEGILDVGCIPTLRFGFVDVIE